MSERIVVTVTAAGIVTAHTEGVLGERCLDYIPELERLLEAQTVDSAYTADYTRSATEIRTEQRAHDVERP
jgi:hypothetical protein